MDHLQAMIDGVSAQWQRERSATQMTLGKLIATLKTMPADLEVVNLHRAHSYRGYYEDIAFERGDGERPAAELLAECNAAMGKAFCGYKGGDFVMGELTLAWVANYGRCGDKLIELHTNGTIETAEEDE